MIFHVKYLNKLSDFITEFVIRRNRDKYFDSLGHTDMRLFPKHLVKGAFLKLFWGHGSSVSRACDF